MYKNEVERSRKDMHAHFGREGRGFQNILPIPRFYRGFRVLCVRVHLTLIMSRCLHRILPRGCTVFGPGKSFELALVIDPAMGLYKKQKTICTTHIIQHNKHHTM